MCPIIFILSSAIALASIPVCASAANNTSRQAVVSATSCPIYEGYPDCGPDGRAVGITVVALAPDGTWGVATEPDTTRAIVNAIRNCKAKYKSEIGCGYQITIRSRGLASH